MARRKRAKQDEGGGTVVAERVIDTPDGPVTLTATKESPPAETNGHAKEAGPTPDPAEMEKQRKALAFDKIAALNHEVSAAAIEYAMANERAKEKKKRWEALVLELQGAIQKHENPPPMPLFDKAPGTNGTPANGTAKPDEAWRTVKLEEAMPDVSEALLAKLYAANIHTVGELSAWTAEDGGRHQITDIDGVGPKMAEKIEEGLTGFWARYKAPPAPETVTEPEEAAEVDDAEASGDGDDTSEEA